MTDTDIAIAKLKEFQSDINDHMKRYFETAAPDLGADFTGNGQEAFNKIKVFSMLPGKRIRGTMAMVGYHVAGGTNRQAALDLAVAVELIQNYLLIVDDVMDRSLTRRGATTVHEAYINELQDDHSHVEALHIGNMLGVNVGLLAQHMASELVGRLDEEPQNVLKVVSLLHKNVAVTCYGQLEDLLNNVSRTIDEEAILTAMRLKSSYYTFINPLQLGAVLAGVEGDLIEEMYQFGLLAGVAFQIQDDIIGLFGDEKNTGKSVTDDLEEGKITLLINHALQNGSSDDVAAIRSVLGSESITVAQHQKIKDIVTATGSLEYSQHKAKEFAAQARSVLQASSWPKDDVQFIDGLMHYVIERNG